MRRACSRRLRRAGCGWDKPFPAQLSGPSYIAWPVGLRTAGCHSGDNRTVNDSDQQFQTGDVVRLKAGGPPMVVRAVSGDTAYCQWYAEVNLHQGTFLFTSLHDINREPRSLSTSHLVSTSERAVQAS